MRQTSLYFIKIATAIPAFSNHHSSQSSVINCEARPSISNKIRYDSLKALLLIKSFKIKVCSLFLNIMLLYTYRVHYSVNITLICTEKQKKKLCDLICCDICFTRIGLEWSLRYAWIQLPFILLFIVEYLKQIVWIH